MSTIGVTYHNEDIHNIIKDPTPPIIKSRMYKSAKRKPDRLADTGMTKGYKSGHQTFGLAHYEAPDARNFLKKKTGNKHLVTVAYQTKGRTFKAKSGTTGMVTYRIRSPFLFVCKELNVLHYSSKPKNFRIQNGPLITKVAHPYFMFPKCHYAVKENLIPDKKQFVCTSDCNLPRLPKWKIECPKSSGKNFVKENIKWVGSLVPKEPHPRRVDSPRGTVKDLKHLIDMIKIREREEYGKVPGYLCERKQQLQQYIQRKRRQEEIEKNYREQMGIGSQGMGENVYMVDKETREKLLQGLKEHWNELSKQFLKLPVMCDTMTKIRRKIWLEKEIDRVEKDVKLVERHPYIYLERTDKRGTDQIAEEILRQQEEAEKKAAEEEKNKLKDVTQEVADDGKEDDQELKVHNYEKELEK